VLGLLAGCSCSRPEAERTSVCATIKVAYDRIVVPKGLTFEHLVDEATPSEDATAVGAVLAFGGTAGAGRYAPTITYLAERYRAGPGDRADEIDPPERTPAIVANARDLDAALADGLCDEEG
jgi:hypothetical protein